jgi:hypothetical protein
MNVLRLNYLISLESFGLTAYGAYLKIKLRTIIEEKDEEHEYFQEVLQSLFLSDLR